MHTEPNEQLCEFFLPFSQPTVAHLMAKTAHGALARLLQSVTWAKKLIQLSQ